MLERLNPVLRIVCCVLAGVAVLQAARWAGRAGARSEWNSGDALLGMTPAATGTVARAGTGETATRGTNATVGTVGTNTAAGIGGTNTTVGTNAVRLPGRAGPIRTAGPRGGEPMGNPNADLPADVQARIDRVTQSEILGAIIRPLPMALLGIAGHDAIVRTPDGRTGLLRVGEELGGVKLLQIGTNRVLIEHEQQRKELTLFSGFGGETLLPNEKKDTK